MQVRCEKVGRTDKDCRTGKECEPIDKAYYIGQTYNRFDKDACTSHKIEAEVDITLCFRTCRKRHLWHEGTKKRFMAGWAREWKSNRELRYTTENSDHENRISEEILFFMQKSDLLVDKLYR